MIIPKKTKKDQQTVGLFYIYSMKLTITSKAFQLPLKHPFSTSRYTVTVQKTVIVSITNGEITGYGEATVNPYYKSTVEKLQDSIESVKPIIEGVQGILPEQLWQQLESKLKHDYFALCAIDCAYWDFYAKLKGRTTRSFWIDDKMYMPQSNFTIGIDAIKKMKQKIQETPWPIYKIKLGTEHDVAIVSELRKITNAIFRIDANCAWTVQETLDNAIELKKLGVEFIEQPLKADDWEEMKILKQESVLPLIADESCQRFEDVEKCLDGFDGINIKLMKCGGMTPALKMIALARSKNIKVMAGCMTESTIGISSLVQIAPLLDYIDADGAMLLKEDIAEGVTLIDGNIIFSHKNGSGAEYQVF
jgi:L-Ala-D/L-Glu epimerase / N-acetyl-D-glutamate racemase